MGRRGSGKTRLADQVAVTAAEQGVLVLRGGCVPLGEEGVPFAPVTEALRGLVRALDPAELEAVAGPARAELGRLVPDLAWGDGGAVSPAVGGAGQGRLFELLLSMLERLAARGPLLLIMEDLHWADRSTRDLVAFLATYLRNGPVLVLLTFRSDELHRLHPLRGLLGELTRNRRVRRLELRRFRRDELAEQLAGLVGEDPPDGLVEEIFTRSEGNPFFAEELVLAGDGAGPAALPPSLQEVLLTRVVRLGRDTQQVLAVAAAAGPGIDHPLLAAVAGMSEPALLDGLREAVDQQVLLPEPGGDGYVFRHALVAEAVYGELLPGERVRLHTALAGALEAGLGAGDAPATRAARIAHHWSAAGDQPRALSASVEAAAAAEQVYAFAEAQLQLERVLALWERVPDAEKRAGADLLAVLSRCAEVAYTAGDNTRAVQLARRALPLADEARQRQRAGLLHERSRAACAPSATPRPSASSRRRSAWSSPSPRWSGLGSWARWPSTWGWWTASRRREGRPRRRWPWPSRSVPGPRRPTPAPPSAPPWPTSARPTPGWPSWRRRTTSPSRPATWWSCSGRWSTAPTSWWRSAAWRRRPRSPSPGWARPASAASATSPRRCSPATPPTPCSPSAAGTRPSGSPARRWSSPPPTRHRSTCPWPGPRSSWASATWTPPRPCCGPPGA